MPKVEMPESFRIKTDSPQLVSKLMLRSEALHRALQCFENLLRTTRFDELFFQSVLMIRFKIAKQNFQKSPIKTKTKLVASASRVQFWFQNFQLWQKKSGPFQISNGSLRITGRLWFKTRWKEMRRTKANQLQTRCIWTSRRIILFRTRKHQDSRSSVW